MNYSKNAEYKSWHNTNMTILYINQMCWTHEPNSVKENTKLKTCKLICNYTIICLPKHVLNLHHARKLTQLSWRHLWIVITVQGEQLIDAYSDIISTLYYWSKIKLVRWLMRKWWRIQKLSSYSYIHMFQSYINLWAPIK